MQVCCASDKLYLDVRMIFFHPVKLGFRCLVHVAFHFPNFNVSVGPFDLEVWFVEGNAALDWELVVWGFVDEAFNVPVIDQPIQDPVDIGFPLRPDKDSFAFFPNIHALAGCAE